MDGRVRGPTCQRSCVGKIVVLAGDGLVESCRSWHACEGKNPIERVEFLSGTPQVVFRRNHEVKTFWPQSHRALADQ